MGRKGQCGGTAGGSRSGRRGALTYNRVIPKFLQRMAGPEYTANPIDAKRHGMDSHPAEVVDDEDSKRREHERDSRKEQAREAWKGDVQGEIRRLEADGFNVVEQPVGEEKGERKQGLESGTEEKSQRLSEKRDESARRLRVRGGIEKKRVSTGPVAKAFNVKNHQKLSFAESDSDSESG